MVAPLGPWRSPRARVALFTAALALLVGGCPPLATAQGVHPITGRPIAPVMGHEGADWLDRPEREQEEAPSRAIAALRLRRGEVVADIGAGSGYYTVRLAGAVGPTGRVFATDIQPEMTAIIKKRVAAARLQNVEVVLAREDDPSLPRESVDLALMVDVYHELNQPQQMLRRIASALKPDGRLALIEFRKGDPLVPIRAEHTMSVAEVRRELEAEGYRFDRAIDVLPWQHIVVFRKPVNGHAVVPAAR